MKTIKMVAKVGDQQVPVGTCNSAQARILVRDDLAAWQDGELILFIRKAHAALLEVNPDVWRYHGDNYNVSDAEVARRKAWFLSFMPLAVEVFTNRAAQKQEIEELENLWDFDTDTDLAPRENPGDPFDVELPDDLGEPSLIKIPDRYVGSFKCEVETAKLNVISNGWQERCEVRKATSIQESLQEYNAEDHPT